MTAPLPLIESSTPALEELALLVQWLNWCYEPSKAGKPTKVPRSPQTGRKASSTDADTWGTYLEAVAACQSGNYSGIGFVLTSSDDFTGIDLDHCRDPETDAIEPWAQEVIDAFDSYTELSPSGTGVHIFVRGQMPHGDGRKSGQVEAYSQKRFFTVTGKHLAGTPETIEARQAQLDAFYARYFSDKPRPLRTAAPATSSHSDADVLARAFGSKRGAEIGRLYAGDASGYPSHSEADLALCSFLAPYCNGDAGQLDRLFRRSGLMRDKWDEQRGGSTYGELTIARALSSGGTRSRSASVPSNGATGRAAKTPAASSQCARGGDLDAVAATFSKWLYLGNGVAMLVVLTVLGTIAANLLPGDPLWLMLVGASSGGKTVILDALADLPYIHAAATLTEGALLSGVPKRDHSDGAKGGLLRQIGDFGVLVLKDFTSVLSMNRDARAAVLAALRELFDGAWTRHVGTDGGKTLHWTGKLGVIGAVTGAIDSFHSVLAALGERFLYFRLPELDPAEQARRALANIGREAEMRRELREVVTRHFAGCRFDRVPDTTTAETERIIALASLVARGRSAIERDAHNREILLVLDHEMPARLAGALQRLYVGCLAIGADRQTAWRVVFEAGFGCLPKLRRLLMEQLLRASGELPTSKLAIGIHHPTNTTHRALEDLEAHRVVQRAPHGGSAGDQWALTEWARTQYAAVCTPEMSDQMSTEYRKAPCGSPPASLPSTDISGVQPADLAEADDVAVF